MTALLSGREWERESWYNRQSRSGQWGNSSVETLDEVYWYSGVAQQVQSRVAGLASLAFQLMTQATFH